MFAPIVKTAHHAVLSTDEEHRGFAHLNILHEVIPGLRNFLYSFSCTEPGVFENFLALSLKIFW